VDGREEALRDDLKLAVMSPLSEDKLLSYLGEIRSDIRQIKSDLQALLTLLQRQQKSTPVTPSDDDQWGRPVLPLNVAAMSALCQKRTSIIFRNAGMPC